jgi:hypothetical protein
MLGRIIGQQRRKMRMNRYLLNNTVKAPAFLMASGIIYPVPVGGNKTVQR